ncbi:3,4-dihydroxy-2-butanone-4-phosphate synthase [Geoglobus acetivorans]|uniref:3,4-dihydroxy-2-butanone 4-phosphate synthase n=1 Tax=Geoglobus acetivorans TaxID=565033 RepID=A0A0A7GAR4_GEOAI|nr:3,4-dihydroxy-2-butanone 4-phosphate synthase [Geoglobus acetivorans]
MIEEAIDAFREGKPVLIYDFDHREGETDIAIPAVEVRPKDVAMLRRDGGGLICVSIPFRAAEKLGLPFMHEILEASSSRFPDLEKLAHFDIKYDSRSSFSLWVNHRDTYTGITDTDRALTIRKIGEAVAAVEKGKEFDFGAEFRSPGHVAVLKASKGLVFERVGQTELSIAVAEMAGIVPAVTICEMLDERTGKALPKADAIKYAEKHGIPFVGGKEIVEYYESLVKIKI